MYSTYQGQVTVTALKAVFRPEVLNMLINTVKETSKKSMFPGQPITFTAV
jgi:hypothetical protein